MHTPSIGYGAEVCAGCASPNCVPPDVVAELRERGLFRPVSTLTDPRLSYPEQFLMQDWDREMEGAVSIYRKTGEGCSQSVEFGAGRWRRITSDLGDRKHIVEMSPTGQSRQWLESAALPELDRGLSATRPLFDAFMQTGASAPEPLEQAAAIAARYRAQLDRLEKADESPADLVPSRPGEVKLADELEARFWETPCGWELSQVGLADGSLLQARAFGPHVWALESRPGEPVRVLYVDQEHPEKSFQATKAPDSQA